MRFILSFLFALTFAFPALAQDQLVQIRLLPERGEITAGEEIWVGIEQVIAPDWHTYWQNPGDSGTAPRISWDLPEGFSVSEIHWPVPDKIPYEPLMNYGYSENVILLQKLKAPENLPDGSIDLKADIEVLVCKEECIPEYGTYTLSLNGANVADNQAYLNEAIKELPHLYEHPVRFTEQDGRFLLVLPYEIKGLDPKTPVEILPLDWGIILNPEEAQAQVEEAGLLIHQARGERDLADLEGTFEGIIAFEQDGVRVGYQFSALTDNFTFVFGEEEMGTLILPLALLFAFIGGLILNLMPCVFPVLSLKALSLVKTAEKHPREAKAHGLAYTAGVILSFLLIAGLLLALKAAGSQIGWGFQLQNPLIVGALAYLTFLLGLNLSGFFEIKGSFTGAGVKLTQGSGYNSSFFTGVLATLVATPCSAPFMAGAIGYALVQPAYVSLAVFTALGLGLAFPYLALSFSPFLQKVLPKPGAWMETFRQFLAFPMLGASVWLVWVLGTQAGVNGILYALSGMVLLAFGIWLLGRRRVSATAMNVIVIALAAFSFAAAILLLPRSAAESAPQMEEMSQGYSAERLSNLLEGDAPVFVEMTASWCITCKVNEAIAINTAATQELFEMRGVEYLVGDWTNKDAAITKYLEEYGRSGVPLYVYYGPRGEDGKRPVGEVLPQILTPSIIRNVIEN